MKKSKEKSKEKSESKKKTGDVAKSTLELLPIRSMDKNIFVMSDETVMDIFKLRTKDLISASENEVELDMLQFEKFYKMFGDDCKIIGINFPTDTKIQQQYFSHKINTETNPLFREILTEKLYELQQINLHHTERAYYLMIFSKNYDKYLEAKNTVTVTLINYGLASVIEPEEKVKVIAKLCNKSTSIYL